MGCIQKLQAETDVCSHNVCGSLTEFQINASLSSVRALSDKLCQEWKQAAIETAAQHKSRQTCYKIMCHWVALSFQLVGHKQQVIFQKELLTLFMTKLLTYELFIQYQSKA